METAMLAAAGDALVLILEPLRMLFLIGGVLMGLALGIIPGIGGVVGLSILLPFTFTMDPYTAFAVLLGMSAVTGTSDTIPAVLFGVPGTSGAQATILDGHAMTKNGEAGRALGAAYVASLIGGVFGALLLALTVPLLRPLILNIGSPELLALSIFGISMVAALSGNAPLRGLAVAGFGILLSMIGAVPQTGTLRWTMGSLYLWEGLPLVPVVLGLFALPELADLAIKRGSIATSQRHDTTSVGMRKGAKDALQNFPLVARCGALGAAIGAIPGMGSAVVDWFAYGHALRTMKGAETTFGKGDVRGVIAPESANNSNNAGSLVPTVAFGVPGSASMAILLGAFLIQGLVPGPDMLTTNLDVTYSMVWSIAFANIFGAGICFLFSGQLAKVALLRHTLILPIALIIIYIGAFQETRSWGDFYILLIFGLIGWMMKRLGWPRPPLILGFVLGALVERYMFISIERYGFDWLFRPVVILFLFLSVSSIVRPLLGRIWHDRDAEKRIMRIGAPRFQVSDLFYLALLVLAGVMMVEALSWSMEARLGPLLVGGFALVTLTGSLFYQIFRPKRRYGAGSDGGLSMDISTDFGDLLPSAVFLRACQFFAWLIVFMISLYSVGMLLTTPLFVITFMRIEGLERWRLVFPMAAAMMVFIYAVFDQILAIPWPHTLLGQLLPIARQIPTV